MHLGLNLFGVLRPTQEFFTHMEIITGEGLQILTYARYSWSWSSEGSTACHTSCDTGHPFIAVNPSLYGWNTADTAVYTIQSNNGHFRWPIIPTPVAERLVLKLYDLRLSRLWLEHPTFWLQGERSNLIRHRRDLQLKYNFAVIWYKNRRKVHSLLNNTCNLK